MFEFINRIDEKLDLFTIFVETIKFLLEYESINKIILLIIKQINTIF